MHELISLSTILFILMDPIGNVPLFIALLKNCPPKRQRIIILRELVIALGVILAFAFLGDYFLDLLKIREDAIMIAGAIILFLISLKMIFPGTKDEALPQQKEPFIVPLAIPFVAGPAVIAAVMLYAKHHQNTLLLVSAILCAWVVSTIILLASSFLTKLLGWRGLLAMERLMGLLLTILAVQMFLQGVASFMVSCNPAQ